MTFGEGHTTTHLEGALISKSPRHQPLAFTLDYKTIQLMQLDQNGDANSWPLGEFLAQDEVRAMILDPACTKPLTFREFVNGRLRSRTPTTGLVHQPRRTMAPLTTSLHRRTPSRRWPWAIQRGLRRPARDRGTETVVVVAHTLIYLP